MEQISSYNLPYTSGYFMRQEWFSCLRVLESLANITSFDHTLMNLYVIPSCSVYLATNEPTFTRLAQFSPRLAVVSILFISLLNCTAGRKTQAKVCKTDVYWDFLKDKNMCTTKAIQWHVPLQIVNFWPFKQSTTWRGIAPQPTFRRNMNLTDLEIQDGCPKNENQDSHPKMNLYATKVMVYTK